MPQVTYRPVSGEPITVDAFADMTLMEVALCNDVPGIVGLCGGICSCATCHVYIDDAWTDRLPAPSGEERDMPDGLDNARANSRLGCQVTVTDALDGLVVSVAEAE
jgi:2Fe-2S ferredoxin